FFESVSVVEQVLHRDPAGMYGCMDFRSRDRYRHTIEELADATGEAQVRVALKAIEFSRRAAENDPSARSAHVGYYLIGAGRRQFERSVEWSPRSAQRIHRLFFRFATPGYLGSIFAGTLAIVAALLVYAAGRGAGMAGLMAVAVLALVP